MRPGGRRPEPRIANLATHPRRYVTPPELAAYLPCDPRTILRMIEHGALAAYRVGRNWRIPTAEACRVFHVERTPHYTA